MSGIAVVILLCVLIGATIIINVLGFVRDRRNKKKNRGVYELQKKIEQCSRDTGRSVQDITTELLSDFSSKYTTPDNAQSGQGINN